MPSKLAQIRSDYGVVWVCLGVSAVVGVTLVAQRMGQARSQRQTQAQQSQIAQQRQRLDLQQQSQAQRRAAIEAQARGWKAWQAHASQRCTATVHQLQKQHSYRGLTLGKTGRPLKPGMFLCDPNYVGILKGSDLRLYWVVPRLGSKVPMPRGNPPPEFQPIAPMQTLAN